MSDLKPLVLGTLARPVVKYPLVYLTGVFWMAAFMAATNKHLLGDRDREREI